MINLFGRAVHARRSAVASVCLVLVACGADDVPATECRVPKDCPDGFTCSSGRCQQVLPTPDIGVDAGRDGAADGPGTDAGVDQLAWPDTGDDVGCQGNQNGKIEREELLFVVPSAADFIVGSKIAVDLTGTEVGGVTHWDLTGDADDDQVEPLALDPVPSWAAAEFPDASYVGLMNKEYATLGVFKITPTKLQLLGAISIDDRYGKITYDEPVDLLRFPIVVGDSYETKVVGSGTWGVAWINNYETYSVEVLAQGVVELPKLSLEALLVREVVTQYPYFNPLFAQSYTIFLFVVECYGTVARIVVKGDPGDALALDAADVKERWRLAVP